MHDLSHLGPKKVFIFGDGSFFITETVVWGVIVALIIRILACWSAQQAAAGARGRSQVITRIRGRKSVRHGTVVMGVKLGTVFAPYMASIFFFMLLSNMLVVQFDGHIGRELYVRTGDHNIFPDPGNGGQVHVGVGEAKLEHMCSPYPFMIIINVIEDVLDAAFTGSATVR